MDLQEQLKNFFQIMKFQQNLKKLMKSHTYYLFKRAHSLQV